MKPTKTKEQLIKEFNRQLKRKNACEILDQIEHYLIIGILILGIIYILWELARPAIGLIIK